MNWVWTYGFSKNLPGQWYTCFRERFDVFTWILRKVVHGAITYELVHWSSMYDSSQHSSGHWSLTYSKHLWCLQIGFQKSRNWIYVHEWTPGLLILYLCCNATVRYFGRSFKNSQTYLCSRFYSISIAKIIFLARWHWVVSQRIKLFSR